MPVPDYQSLMLPLLRYADSTGNEITTTEAVDALANQLNLSENDLSEMLPSGVQPTIVNRISWAATYMKKAGLLKTTRRGFYQITPRGRVLHIQAKRWENTPVGRPEVMQFAGALQLQHASKGIFITTSRFTDEARAYVKQIGSKVVLIDGSELAELMIDHDIGVSTISVYPVKKIDSDYFSED